MASNVRVRQTSHRKAAHPESMGWTGSDTTRDGATLSSLVRDRQSQTLGSFISALG